MTAFRAYLVALVALLGAISFAWPTSILTTGAGKPASGPACSLTYTTNLALGAVSTAGITQAGGTVSAWTDSLSGNARDFAEVTNKPTYNASGLNGLPTISFDSTTDVLTSTSFVQNVPWTVFAALRIDTNTNGNVIFEGSQAATSGSIARGGSSVVIMDESLSDGPSASMTTGTWYIVKLKANGASSGFSLNAGSDAAGGSAVATAMVTSGNTLKLGANSSRGASPFTIGAFLLYNEATSGTSTSGNQQTVINYLNCLYAVF